MPIQIQGNAGVVTDVGGTLFRALNVQSKPLECLGQYQVSVVTGTLAAALAANAQVFQFKVTTAGVIAVVTRILARFHPLTPFTAATLTDHTSFDAVVARSYAGGGLGTVLNLTSNNAKLRTNYATSVAQINISTTSALTLATTLDVQPFAQSIRKGNRINPAAATEEIILPSNSDLEFRPRTSDGESPLILAQNEGFVVRNRTVWPAAGTGILMVEMEWAEVVAY